MAKKSKKQTHEQKYPPYDTADMYAPQMAELEAKSALSGIEAEREAMAAGHDITGYGHN